MKRLQGRRAVEVRAAFLRQHPLCLHCQREGRATPATEVDHVVALVNGGGDVDSNKQPLCKEHHMAKTREDLGHKPRSGCDANGLPIDAAHH